MTAEVAELPEPRRPDLSEAVRSAGFAVAFAVIAAAALSLAVRAVGNARWEYVEAKDVLRRRWSDA